MNLKEHVEQVLKKQKGSRKKKRTKGDFAAEEVAKSMHDFINKISSYEGAELPSDGYDANYF